MPWNVSKHVNGKSRTVFEVGVVPVSKTKGGEHGSLWIIGYYFGSSGKKRTRCSVGHREILMMRSIHLVSMMHGDFFHVWQTCWCRCRSCFSFSSCSGKICGVLSSVVKGGQCANGFEFFVLEKNERASALTNQYYTHVVYIGTQVVPDGTILRLTRSIELSIYFFYWFTIFIYFNIMASHAFMALWFSTRRTICLLRHKHC